MLAVLSFLLSWPVRVKGSKKEQMRWQCTHKLIKRQPVACYQGKISLPALHNAPYNLLNLFTPTTQTVQVSISISFTTAMHWLWFLLETTDPYVNQSEGAQSLPWFWSMDVQRDTDVKEWMNDCRFILVYMHFWWILNELIWVQFTMCIG